MSRQLGFLDSLASQPSSSFRFSLGISFAAALLWLIIRLAILAHVGPPHPHIQDEMSYLLGADTLAHGRLANPPLPLGRFFESPHILVAPTYASKYPPGQALFLALGQVWFGTPFAGVIIGAFAMIVGFGLMFCAWVSPKWAAIFSFASALGFQWPRYWVTSYWGGCVAALGAALLLTAAGRFLRNSGPTRLWDPSGLLLALGLVLLFFTRPYEGGVLAIGVIGSLLWRRPRSKRWLPLILTALPVLVGGIGWNLRYNQAITGHALELPYRLYELTYETVPKFLFLPLHHEHHYEQPQIAVLLGSHGAEVINYHEARQHPLRHYAQMFTVLASVLGPLVGFVFLLPFGWKDERCRFLTPIVILCCFAGGLTLMSFAHYLAPAITVTLLLCACLADSPGLAHGRFGRRWWALALVSLAAVANISFTAVRLVHMRPENLQRFSMIDQCLQVPGKHLVLVRYEPTVPAVIEWVYNSADLDSQRVILAHDLGPVQDKLLEQLYPDRTVWSASVAGTTLDEASYTLRRVTPP